MKQMFFMDGKQKRLFLGLICMIIAIISVLSWGLIKKGENIVGKEVNSYLNELSQQTSFKVEQRVETNVSYISNIANELKYISETKYEAFVNDSLSSSAFEWFGFMDNKDILHVEGREPIHIDALHITEKLKTSDVYISDELVSLYKGEKGLIYAVPYLDNDDYTAIIGYIPVDTMKLLMNTDTFSGTGFSHIISYEGNYIKRSTNENALLDGSNFFTSFEERAVMESGYSLAQMKADMKDGKSGSFEFRVDGQNKRTLTYKPLEGTSWYLLSIVPSTIYARNLLEYINMTIFVLVGSLFVLFIGFIFILTYRTYKANKEISDLAYKDSVTEGISQIMLEIELKKKLKNFHPYTFVSLDLRKFKLINDTFGADAGNQVLAHVYKTIHNKLHAGEFVARINADNFNIVFNSTDEKEIKERLQDIAQNINVYNINSDKPYYMPISCGCYVVKDESQEIVVIRDKANIARKKDKENSAHHLCTINFYNDMEHEQMIKEKRLENMMEKALKEEEFVVYLQPKVSLKTGHVIGSEALVRWDSPTDGMILPNDFIPLFEKNDFIIKLDLYVFEKVCQTLKEWIDSGKEALPISVNLSRNHLRYNNFLKEYKYIQERYDIPSHLIEIELTETVVFENLELLKNVIDEIHEFGYLCSMDDFGSGYSSLNVLKEIPVDILKLDKVFFEYEDDKKAEYIIESVIDLANHLGMETIAEGVETIPQVELLKALKCDIVQGYVFSKPLPISSFEELLENNPKLMNP